MEESNVYDKFIDTVEKEEFTKFEESIGYWIFEIAEALDKNITFIQLKDIISAVSMDKNVLNIIDDIIKDELSKIPGSEVER